MSKDIQECMSALIVQHGSALVALATFQQHPKGEQNDEQTDFLEKHVPHINVPAEFNEDKSESARERRNHLLREQRAR